MPSRKNTKSPPPAGVKGEKLLPADKVYNRIMWDDRIPPGQFEIGYEDRFKGLMWIDLPKFRIGDDPTREIPFHRVYKIRFKGYHVVWDRNARTDTLDELYEAVAAGRPLAVPTVLRDLKDATSMQVVPPLQPLPINSKEVRLLKVVTFNVLFDLFDQAFIHTPERLQLTIGELKKADADIIMLQEVTPTIFKFIASHPSIASSYYVTKPLEDDTKSSQVILSRLPLVEAASVEMSRNKRLILATIMLDQRVVLLVNAHLISDYGGPASMERRQRELKHIFGIAAEFRQVLFSGDFNFGDTDPEQKDVNWGSYVDAWTTLHPDDPGYTFDLTTNWLANFTCQHKRYPRRLDRTLALGAIPVSCERIGTEPTKLPLNIAPNHPFFLPKTDTQSSRDSLSSPVLREQQEREKVFPIEELEQFPMEEIPLFPSDHFGVAAVWDMSHLPDLAVTPPMDPMFPVLNTALVVILPESLFETVNFFRKRYDKAYPRWMPHISLLFPFIHPSKFPDGAALVEQVAATTAPFNIRLASCGTFPAKKNVFWLKPECKDNDLVRMQGRIQELFPACKRHNRTEFTPHATLGQVESDKLVGVLQEVHTMWTPTDFTVSHIHIIAHLENTEGYVVVHSIPLRGGDTGSAKCTPQVSPALKPAVSPEHRPMPPPIPNLADFVLEDPVWGNKPIAPYIPADALEMWCAAVSVRQYARECPTHISQLGAMYHVPADLYDTYLREWCRSVLNSGETPFYLEEVRGNNSPFRLYLDLDVKRTVEERFDPDELLQAILRFTRQEFPGCDATVLVCSCHGPWKDNTHTDAVFKSGFRLYFQRVFVDESVFARYIRRLIDFLERYSQLPAHFPEKAYWEDICDMKIVEWTRARLLGTMKRRKNLKRVYQMSFVLDGDGKLDEEFTNGLGDHLAALLHASTVRLWDVAPSDTRVTRFDNSFERTRFFHQK